MALSNTQKQALYRERGRLAREALSLISEQLEFDFDAKVDLKAQVSGLRFLLEDFKRSVRDYESALHEENLLKVRLSSRSVGGLS